jgi:hypothetical protein
MTASQPLVQYSHGVELNSEWGAERSRIEELARQGKSGRAATVAVTRMAEQRKETYG